MSEKYLPLVIADEFGKLSYKDAEKIIQIMYPPLGCNDTQIQCPQKTRYDNIKELLISISRISLWSANKQVYKIDPDFLNELVDTDKIKIIKDIYDYLPYRNFYVDISDNSELKKNLSKAIQFDGFFVSVEKYGEISNYESKYGINGYSFNVVLVASHQVLSHNFYIPNDDYDITVTDDKRICNDPLGDVPKVDFNASLLRILVLQTLTYMASEKPDVRENPTTERTYRKPNPYVPPKNKFSEVRIQDVGVRFGNAFRTWHELKEHRPVENHTGTRKRPHSRKAHWHTYCCGKNHSERKVIWQHEMYINMDLGESDAVVHKVEKGKNGRENTDKNLRKE